MGVGGGYSQKTKVLCGLSLCLVRTHWLSLRLVPLAATLSDLCIFFEACLAEAVALFGDDGFAFERWLDRTRFVGLTVSPETVKLRFRELARVRWLIGDVGCAVGTSDIKLSIDNINKYWKSSRSSCF